VEPERPSATIPAELTRRAEAIAAGDADWVAPPPRDAATIILLRERSGSVEVFLQRRVGKMAFAAGMYVFPGGKVERSDADPEIGWNGPARWEPFHQPPDHAPTASFRALTVAAARATWEEAGVALAALDNKPVSTIPAQAADPFLDWVRSNNYVVNAAAFAPFAHWVTPEVESRRFDTRFLVTELPGGQSALDRGWESDESAWFRPADAMDQHRSGALAMLPPTSHSLQQLADFDSVAAVMAAARARNPEPILPRPAASATGNIEWQLVHAYTGQVLHL